MRRYHTYFRLLALMALATTACYRFTPKPIQPDETLARIESRSLTDAALRPFLERHLHRVLPEWPPPQWSLETLTLCALYFHPDMDAARARWSQAQGGAITAGQRPNPVLSVAPPSYNVTTAIPSPWLVTVSLDVPIETAGKRGHRLAQALQLSEAARQGIAATAWQVRARVRQALVDFWEADEATVLLGEKVAAHQEVVRLLEARLAAGEIAPTEVTRERIALDQTRLTTLDATSRRGLAQIQLATAVGLPPHALEGVSIAFDAFTEPPRAIPDAEARRRALLARPDVLAALAEYAASEAALRLEIAKQYPDLHLNPGYEFDQGSNKWGLGLGIELPVLNQNAGPIAEAEAHRAELAAKFTALQARVLGEIEAGLADYEAARSAVGLATSLLRQAEGQERRQRAMLRVGEVSGQEVAAARLERTTAALAWLDARLRVQRTLGQLEAILQSPSELPIEVVDSLLSPVASTEETRK